jgi:hypothetical protein
MLLGLRISRRQWIIGWNDGLIVEVVRWRGCQGRRVGKQNQVGIAFQRIVKVVLEWMRV